MPEPKPSPTRDANGLPLCSEDACALYDGKRCRALGFRPDRFCEPALVDLESVRVEQAAKLHRHLDELAAARARIEDLETVLLACPMDHHNGKLTWHRSPTEADLVAWVDRVRVVLRDLCDDAGHEETPGPADRYGWPIGTDGFTRVSCDRDRTGEYPCPGCGQPAGSKCARPVNIAATTIEQAPPEDLLDRITPEEGCRHTRRSLRPDPHGNPETTCLDCGEPTNP
jgi:hypothetical protein